MPIGCNNEAPFGDCNKCGAVGDVSPQNGICESCGCTDPEADYPEAEWLVGQNPFANSATPTDSK